jgi:hypothetical protein
MLLIATGFGAATPVGSTGLIHPSGDALLAAEDLPAGFEATALSPDPADLCGNRLTDLALPLVPRSVIGRLFMATPGDGMVASVEEALLSFMPGDGPRFMALLTARPSCPHGRFVRVDGMSVRGPVKALSLRGLDGDVSAFSICGPAYGRPLAHLGSRVDQLMIRHGDTVGVLTYASYGFFFDEGVRNRLAQQFSDRLGSLP